MEPLYERFNSYDFGSDARFQEGLKKVSTSDSSKGLLKLKIFFYNRFVEPIDLTGFAEWEAKRRSDGEGAGDANTVENDAAGDVMSSSRDAPFSFAEVLRMIQAGEEIPGLQKLDIRAVNLPPTASQMSRRIKPWEQ